MGKPVRSLFLSKMEENHMEETNVTMTTEKTQGEPDAKENETKAEKFIRIGEYRMNKAVDAIGRLENLANRSFYEYTQEQVDAMFQALEGRGVEVKVRFMPKKAAESKTFSFGIMLMYGKEASNRKQEIDRQHYTIPNQRPKDKHCGKI
jgi:hypothetical protein